MSVCTHFYNLDLVLWQVFIHLWEGCNFGSLILFFIPRRLLFIKFLKIFQFCFHIYLKLQRGQFRPRLKDLVQMNTPRVVMQETKKAFRQISKKNDLESAVQALSNLKGVGPAMASGTHELVFILAAASVIPTQVFLKEIPDYFRWFQSIFCSRTEVVRSNCNALLTCTVH